MFFYKYRDNLKLFLFWGVVCLLANILCTLGSAYDGDQSFWVGWVQQLQDGGFGNFKGNYPPLYVFWLWVVGLVHSVFGIAVGKTFILKFLCLWPVYFSHLFLVDWLCRVTQKFGFPTWKKHLLLAFVALNPVILLNGPIWGQVDLFPVLLAVLSIYCISRPRLIRWASLLYVLSLLTKFQMITFLPVFGGIFLRNWKTSWKGLPFAVLGALIVLLPFIVGSNLQGELTRAYVQTTSQYAYATFNATNLWYLWAGNVAPDNVPIWGVSENGLGFLLKPSLFGKILFVAISIFVLVKSILCKNIRTAYALCTLNALAFFVVLPGMHERYLIYAVPMAICWCVWDMRRGGIIALLVTLVAALNISLVNPLRGIDVWQMAAFFACIALLLAILINASPKFVCTVVQKIKGIPLPVYTPYVLLSIILLIQGATLVYRSLPVTVPSGNKIMLVTDLRMVVSNQSYKAPKINSSVEDRLLTAGDRLYKYGIGTHAPSTLGFVVPENVDSLFIGTGIDDECYDRGEAKFVVKVNGRDVWSSRILSGKDGVEFAKIDMTGANYLELITDPNGNNSCDHTDWLNGYVKLK